LPDGYEANRGPARAADRRAVPHEETARPVTELQRIIADGS
jgi:hypothetical protein